MLEMYLQPLKNSIESKMDTKYAVGLDAASAQSFP